MAPKLTARQQAQLAWLTTLPPKFEKLNRLIELMATMQADDAAIRAGARLLDEMKSQASSLGITALSDTFGYMGTLLRRSGSQQVRVRGLREMLAGAKINHEGALRAASTPEPGAADEPVSPS
jgi:hypothetical protein